MGIDISSTTKLSPSEIEILKTCADIVNSVANIYHIFAHFFIDNKNISNLLLSIATEKENHAKELKFAVTILGSGMKSVRIDLPGAQLMLTKIRFLSDKIQSKQPVLIDGLKTMIKLESKLFEYNMSSLVEFEDEQVCMLFEEISEGRNNHLQMLQHSIDSL